MRFMVSFALLFAVMMGATWIGERFGLVMWQMAVLAGIASAATTYVEHPILKAWERWRGAQQISKE